VAVATNVKGEVREAVRLPFDTIAEVVGSTVGLFSEVNPPPDRFCPTRMFRDDITQSRKAAWESLIFGSMGTWLYCLKRPKRRFSHAQSST